MCNKDYYLSVTLFHEQNHPAWFSTHKILDILWDLFLMCVGMNKGHEIPANIIH